MPRSPSFIGVNTNEIPAKVKGGLACSQDPPLQVGSRKGTSELFSWRTATALGWPVVPEV